MNAAAKCQLPRLDMNQACLKPSLSECFRQRIPRFITRDAATGWLVN